MIAVHHKAGVALHTCGLVLFAERLILLFEESRSHLTKFLRLRDGLITVLFLPILEVKLKKM